MMASLRHPNVLAFIGMCQVPPCVITEYCAKGSMTDVLRIGRKDPAKAAQLTWSRRLAMALDAAKGMLYLHQREPAIIHRDLKSANLLVDSHWRVKVSDFNLSKLMEESHSGGGQSTLGAMNPRWLAPELLQGEKATQASDVYAFGVVLWELLTWELPWEGQNPWSLVSMIINGGRLTIPPRAELPGPDAKTFAGLDGYLALLQRCWAQNEFERPPFSEIIPALRRLLESTVGAGAVVHGSTSGSPGGSPPSNNSAAASKASVRAEASLQGAAASAAAPSTGTSLVPAAASAPGPSTPADASSSGQADGAAESSEQQQQGGVAVYRTTSEAWRAMFGSKAT